MATSPIATAADYADAMMAARRAKNWLFLLLLAAIGGQVATFFVLRTTPTLREPITSATTRPNWNTSVAMEYLVALSDFLGVVLPLVLSMVLLLIVKIMLVGRLIGVSKVTSAFIWCLVLMVLLFPWQSLLVSPVSPPVAADNAARVADFKIPGALYTWSEVTNLDLGATFDSHREMTFVILRWARFVGFPAIAMILVLMIQTKSSRGLQMALGEVEFDVAEGSAGH